MIDVFDIDGTLLDNKHRVHLIKGDKKDWDKFYDPQLVAKDTPIEKAQKLVAKLLELKHQLVFMTGRPESLRDVTAQALNDHFNVVVTEESLLMRDNGNMQSAASYKREQITDMRSHTAMHNASYIFFDDDWRNAEMYQEFGLFFHAPECFDQINPVEPQA
jgi:hydroxymethylpyrimidine pyrophosphatase-like HAD family hydrolase